MAGRQVNNTAKDINTEQSIENLEESIAKPLNYEEKITIKNIANWMVGFKKKETHGEVNITPNGTIRITRGEVISQFENGNKLLRGVGNGKHATIFIDDKKTRDYLDIDSVYIDKKLVLSIFNIEGLSDFENKIKEVFVTKAEKTLLIKYMKECEFNDYNKIKFCEAYCEINI